MQIFDALIETSETVEFVEIAADGLITRANSAFCRHIGSDALVGEPIISLMPHRDGELVTRWLKDAAPVASARLNFVGRDQMPYTLCCVFGKTEAGLQIIGEPDRRADEASASQLAALNNELAVLSREHARRGKDLQHANDRLQAALADLETSYWHLRRVQEVLPICMKCGDLKTEEHKWQSVTDYFREHEIFMSHGYCPECFETVIAEFGLEEDA